MNILYSGLQIIWLLLPALVANMMPVVAARLKVWPALDRPLDGGKIWRNRAIFGEHKTVRGLVAGTAGGAAVGVSQYLCWHFLTFPFFSLVAYVSFTQAFFLGAALGAVALVGDALKSFFKRQFNIRPGKGWPPFDQIDFVISSLLFIGLFVPLTVWHVVSALFFIGVGSFVVSVGAVLLGIKESL